LIDSWPISLCVHSPHTNSKHAWVPGCTACLHRRTYLKRVEWHALCDNFNNDYKHVTQMYSKHVWVPGCTSCAAGHRYCSNNNRALIHRLVRIRQTYFISNMYSSPIVTLAFKILTTFVQAPEMPLVQSFYTGSQKLAKSKSLLFSWTVRSGMGSITSAGTGSVALEVR